MKAPHSDTVSENSQVSDPLFSIMFQRHKMQPSSSKGVKKSWSERNSLVQMHYQQKGTLRRMLRSYFDDCCCRGVYLLIHKDNRYFTIKFNKDDVLNNHFPPPDKDIEKLYPPPSRTTCKNYPKPQKSKKKGQGKATTQKPLNPLQNSKQEFQQMEDPPSSTELNCNHAAAPQQRILQQVIEHG
ncbi:hypothetical protein I7I53_04209 [Histoplasma capsulatum var. duboisii H88]|uniref:Uncharacterized protein n=1 Tax=Ajellomyces capsulatus (strain H88) TaxID=544711 RepID=A0A8A1LQ91_AJEC8|nr:hypothetical protein I7I53_04209 [Histoplasma capsulatum var. duboisii H88]